MTLFLLAFLAPAARADLISVPRQCPPNCLKVADLDGVIVPPEWLETTAKELDGTGGLNSLTVYVSTYVGRISVQVDGVTLSERNLVRYDRGTAVYSVPVPSGEFKVTVQNIGEEEAGYDVSVEGSSDKPL
jgi:hypothetical protein